MAGDKGFRTFDPEVKRWATADCMTTGDAAAVAQTYSVPVRNLYAWKSWASRHGKSLAAGNQSSDASRSNTWKSSSVKKSWKHRFFASF